MQPFLQQLPALLGVLLGAAATFTATSAAERARWRRAQAVRWDEKRLTAYSEYAHAMKKLISIAVQLASTRGVHPDAGTVTPDKDVPTMAAAEEERTSKWEAVLLLGSGDVIVAARGWHNAVFRLQRIAAGLAEESWAEAVQAVSLARREFYQAANKDLGIAIGDDPASYEWQLAKLVPVEPKKQLES